MNANNTRVLVMVLGIVFFLNATTATAQRAGTLPPSDLATSSTRAQSMFEQYKGSRRKIAASEEQLVQILNLGLPRTEANVIGVRTLLAAPSDSVEKIGLVRLLAAQYERADPSHRNDLIIHDLRILTTSSDKGLARAATFAFTRLGFLPGFEEVLGNALNSSAINDDEYFGEIAHAMAFAPTSDQVRLAKVLRQSKNLYAAEIVAMGVNSGFLSAKWTNDTRAEFGLLLESTEPVFPRALGLYDLLAAVQYSNWLNASALVRSSALNKEGAEFILSKLNEPRTDPRKIMAFLSSEYGPRLFQLIGEKARFLIVLNKISIYSKQHPQNNDMREIVVLVNERLAQILR
jgi:hypothetical protein